MYKPLSDSTLMGMTKKEIIEHLRIAEHNHKVCEEQIDQQYKNCMELLKKERADTIDDICESARQLRFASIDGREIFLERLCKLAEQLKGAE